MQKYSHKERKPIYVLKVGLGSESLEGVLNSKCGRPFTLFFSTLLHFWKNLYVCLLFKKRKKMWSILSFVCIQTEAWEPKRAVCLNVLVGMNNQGYTREEIHRWQLGHFQSLSLRSLLLLLILGKLEDIWYSRVCPWYGFLSVPFSWHTHVRALKREVS